MNLNDHPTLAQLQTLIAAADDDAGNHILWVDAQGEVRLSVLAGQSPNGFEDTHPSMRLRYETCDQGNGYVGPEAANDVPMMSRYFTSLIAEWRDRRMDGRVEYVDSW